MWQMSMTAADSRWLQSKHIFVGGNPHSDEKQL
jgi:hypothetical protein